MSVATTEAPATTPIDEAFAAATPADTLPGTFVSYTLKNGTAKTGLIRDAVDVTIKDKPVRFVTVASLNDELVTTNVWVRRAPLA